MLLVDGHRIEVVLQPKDYRLAAAVHTEGALLRVRGLLERNGRGLIQDPQEVAHIDCDASLPI